ncbi:hypothetical protein J1614_008622 [Plenodomus biglobosus]|nr:hypothetical protein J1614_008622 [Plenodomus biglobosus]
MASPKISSSSSPTVADLEAENERLEAENLRLEVRIEKLGTANKELKEELDFHRQEGEYPPSLSPQIHRTLSSLS